MHTLKPVTVLYCAVPVPNIILTTSEELSQGGAMTLKAPHSAKFTANIFY